MGLYCALALQRLDGSVLATLSLSLVSPGVAAFKTAACRGYPVGLGTVSLGARSPSHHACRATAVLSPARLSRCHARAAWQTHRNASQTHRSPPFPSTIFAATRDIRFVALTDSLRTNLSPLRPRTEHCSNPSHPPTEPCRLAGDPTHYADCRLWCRIRRRACHPCRL